MNKKLYKYSIILLGFVFTLGFTKSDSDYYLEITKSIDIFGRIYKEVSLNYVDDIKPQEFMMNGIKGMLLSLDPYTVYIDENQQNDIDLITKGKYGGIGVSIGIRDDKVTIVDIIDGYSAEKQGIRIGDVLLQVDSVVISKENYDNISNYVKGEPGTLVDIKIMRDGYEQPISFKLKREEIEIKNLVYSAFYPKESNNAYLKLISFSKTAGNEIQKALIDLQKEKEIKSIILDLRSNPGGLLDAAIDVSEKFLSKDQLIVSVKGKDTSQVTSYFSKEFPVAKELKLAVLINEGSASASEIVAGAIQDHDRGIIIGEKSFGKGLVQTVYPLSYNTSIKITTARYYTPSGRSIQKIDYTKNNKVIDIDVPTQKKAFSTDNMRIVYSAGGITPDFMVSSGNDSGLVNILKEDGHLFHFCNSYYDQNNQIGFEDIDVTILYNEFKEFLMNKNFKFKNSSLVKAEDLLNELKKTNADVELRRNIENLISELSKNVDSELLNNKQNIINELRAELASRFNGQIGKITESLKFDKQFKAAYDILSNNSEYRNYLK